MKSTRSEFWRANIYMHLSILLWGITAPIGKSLQLSEGVLVWYRLILVSVSLGISLFISRKSLRIPLPDLIRMAGIGVLLMIHWLFFYGAIKYSNVSITLSTFSSTALFTAILEPLVWRQKIKREELFFGLITILGIGVIFHAETGYALGIFLSLMATFVGSFFNILNRQVVQQYDAEVISFVELFSGLLFLTLILPLYIYLLDVQKIWPDNREWGLLLILAVLCTHVTVVLSLKALRHLSAFTLNLAINLEPVYGIALAFLLFQEDKMLHTGFYIGSGIVFLTVLVHALYSYHCQKQINHASN